VIYFCTNCWAEIEKSQAICLHCGAIQERLGRETFVEKLIRALHHPEAETPIRAAFVLGQLRAQVAVPALSLVLHSSLDPYIAAACADALGRIGSATALDQLKHALNVDRSVIVRRAVENALRNHKNSMRKKEI